MFELNRPTIMTVFFQRSTGIIKCIADYETNIDSYFVNEYDREDYKLIWDFAIVEYNETIFNNQDLFYVDLETKKINMKEVITKQI